MKTETQATERLTTETQRAGDLLHEPVRHDWSRCGARFTPHAKRRWYQRCNTLSPSEEWIEAKRRRTGKRTKKLLAKLCPGHADECSHYAGRYFKVSRNRVVFVVAPPETIVTVFILPNADVSRRD